MKNCIIVGAGEQTVSHIPQADKDFVIAVDAGMQYCRKAGAEPGLYIGDFDSLSEADRTDLAQIEKEKPGKVIRLKPEKDDTDMLAACKYAVTAGFTEISIYGATGGRLDHTIANIQCLLYLKRQGVQGMLVDRDEKILVLENETLTLPAEENRTVSIFSMGEAAGKVTLEGLKYPLKEYCMTNDFPIGTSNEMLGKEAKITVEGGALVVLIHNRER